MKFFQTLLILIVFYYSFKVIVRLLLPFLVKWWLKKAQANFNRQQGYVDPQEAKKREGEVHIKSTPQNKSSVEDLGEYVDYEEIKEDKK
jgi:hypothetical protein